MNSLRIFLISASLCAASVLTAHAAQAPVIVMPAQVHWIPGTGPLTGTEMAVIDGNPSGTGEYTIRIRMKDGYRLPIHYHGHPERVTVLSGTLLVALGDKIVPASKMVALPAGTYVDVPPGVHHYAMARGLTVLQVSSEAPRTMVVVQKKM